MRQPCTPARSRQNNIRPLFTLKSSPRVSERTNVDALTRGSLPSGNACANSLCDGNCKTRSHYLQPNSSEIQDLPGCTHCAKPFTGTISFITRAVQSECVNYSRFTTRKLRLSHLAQTRCSSAGLPFEPSAPRSHSERQGGSDTREQPHRPGREKDGGLG